MTDPLVEQRHGRHDEVAATVESWYREPAAEFTVELRELGWCRRPHSVVPSVTPNVTVQGLTADRLEVAIADAAAWLGGDDFRVVIDDRGLDSHLRKELERLGWERTAATIYLCHVGEPPSKREDVVLRQVGAPDDEMAEWIRRRGLAFADTEWVRPSAPNIATEIRQRRLQKADGAQMFLVDRGGDSAGIVAWYEGLNRFVFNLAVLPEQRGRGIGAAVMARAIAGAERSTLVNTDEEDGPVELYRRWGFTDEVYRRITYRRRDP